MCRLVATLTPCSNDSVCRARRESGRVTPRRRRRPPDALTTTCSAEVPPAMKRLVPATPSVWVQSVGRAKRVSIVLLVAAVLGFAWVTPSLADPPTLSYCVPSAVMPGKATDVMLFGGNL